MFWSRKWQLSQLNHRLNRVNHRPALVAARALQGMAAIVNGNWLYLVELQQGDICYQCFQPQCLVEMMLQIFWWQNVVH